MTRYKRASTEFANVYVDTDTGESFIASGNSDANTRFQEWIAAGNAPDDTPMVDLRSNRVEPRGNRINRLATTAKQALSGATLGTQGERQLATIFGQALDALAALDPVVPLPPDPVPSTIEVRDESLVSTPVRTPSGPRVAVK